MQGSCVSAIATVQAPAMCYCQKLPRAAQALAMCQLLCSMLWLFSPGDAIWFVFWVVVVRSSLQYGGCEPSHHA